jgi:hypothetical protein
VCQSPHMRTALSRSGLGLLVVSLFVALLLSGVDPLWADQHVTLLAAVHWVQQAALVMGAALFAGGHVVARLAPPPVAARDDLPDAHVDWYA